MKTLRERIGEETYLNIDSIANKEVAGAMQMDLLDKWGVEKYYQMSSVLSQLLSEAKHFQNADFKISPFDIVRILFMTKLLYAVKSEHEYYQRVGGSSFEESPFSFKWDERNEEIELVISTHLKQLEQSVIERVLVVEILDFNTDVHMGSPTIFFDELFKKIAEPFGASFDEETLLAKYKEQHPGASQQTQSAAIRYFSAPSISFTYTGSSSYVYFHGTAYLRTFLNLLRIAGFLNRSQIDFGMWGVQMRAPSGPFFRQPGTMGGGYFWEQDTKEPWEKIPDGCLFLSFGYRGLTKIFLDNRTFTGMEKFFLENKVIFEKLVNPWTDSCISDIAPTLDILSSATQMPDLGAKILQVYCCLEHLFVPKNVTSNNVKYIIGAINALRPDLIPWFNQLYKLRCDYAHKGYVQRDDKTLSTVFESVSNATALLTAKLKQA